MKTVHIISVMDPKNAWCRNHTMLMAKAMGEKYSVVIISNGFWDFSDEEDEFFKGCAKPTMYEKDHYFNNIHKTNDFLLYQFGNNNHFFWITECFLKYPGAVLMHDISLFWLMSENPKLNQTFMEEELGVIDAMMVKNSLDWRRPKLALTGAHVGYFNRAILQYATGVITHSHFQANGFRTKFPAKPVNSIDLVPNFLYPLKALRDREGLKEKRAKYGIKDDTVSFGILGFQSFHKRVVELLEGFVELDEKLDIKIFLIGKWEDNIKTQAGKALKILEARKWVILEDRYVTEPELEEYITLSDIVVNFRYPTAGESSGIACQCLAIGVPLMVNKIGSFVDLPEKSVFRVPYSKDGNEKKVVSAALKYILENPEALKEKQLNAQNNVDYYKLPRYRQVYERIIEDQMANYEERLEIVSKRLSVRRANDAWSDLTNRSSGDLIIIYDELGNGLRIKNPVFDLNYILSIINHELGYLEDLDLSRHETILRSPLAKHGSLNLLDKDIKLDEVATICIIESPSSEVATLEEYMSIMQKTAIGSRIYTTRRFIDILTMGMNFDNSADQSSVYNNLLSLAIEQKTPGEIAIFAEGMVISGELFSDFGNLICLRRTSDILFGKAD